MIVPDTITINDSYETTRRYLTADSLLNVARLDFPVFKGPAVRTAIPILGSLTDDVEFLVYVSAKSLESRSPDSLTRLRRHLILERPGCKWLFGDVSHQNLLLKIQSCSIPLEQLAETRDGINPGPKSFRSAILNPSGPQRSTWRSVIQGRHIERFQVLPTTDIVDYDPKLLTPALKKQGASFREAWIFSAPKLVSRQTADTLIFALDDVGHCALNSVHNTLAKDGKRETLLFLLGVLNSRLMHFYYRRSAEEVRDVFPQVHISALRKLPIRPINFSDPADRARHDRMVALVERMLELHRRLAAARLPHERSVLETQIAATDREIDRLVYELYGLTEEEIKIVEGEG